MLEKQTKVKENRNVNVYVFNKLDFLMCHNSKTNNHRLNFYQTLILAFYIHSMIKF